MCWKTARGCLVIAVAINGFRAKRRLVDEMTLVFSAARDRTGLAGGQITTYQTQFPRLAFAGGRPMDGARFFKLILRWFLVSLFSAKYSAEN